ncbi:hypothetical protein QE152_g24755 [Popillia japonica]|uniref:Uncharacterized protein n=1 Tax=Popillia japonica TaxID=7064 RepID=A0AAW1K6B0_POPJA
MNSDSSEESKERKAAGEEYTVFAKSKMIVRSPVKQQKGEEKLDKLGAEQELIKEKLISIQQENKVLKNENMVLRQENAEIKKEDREMRIDIERREKEQRRNNIVMTGLPIDTDNTNILKEAMENFIKEHLEIDVKVQIATKLGAKTCLIALGSKEEKFKIIENKKKLKELQTHKIFINDDLTKKEREKQTIIRKAAKEERIKGNTVKIGDESTRESYAIKLKMLIEERDKRCSILKWNVDKFRDESTRESYAIKLKMLIEERDRAQENVDKEWKITKECIEQAAKE